MSVQAAKEKAAQVIEENFISEFPIDIEDLALQYGLSVERRTFPSELSNISGFIELDGGGKPRVVVNGSDSPNRQTFTIAHELGHWLLHKDELLQNPNLGILFRIPLGKLNTDDKEKEANTFAGDLLVPDNKLREALDENRDLNEIARNFGVSSDVIGYRVAHLSRGSNGSPTRTSQARPQ